MTRAIVLLPAVLLGLHLGIRSAGAESYKGKEFPDFTAKDALTGNEFSLSDLRGKVVLIDFWATWCGPCVRELPHVKRAYSRYHRQGFEIVSISLDKNRSRFDSFVRQKRMKWHHVMEGGGWNTRLARKYKVSSIPRMLVLDPDGVCIGDSLRGSRLDAVIERGLSMIKEPSGDGERPDRARGREQDDPRDRRNASVEALEQIEAIAEQLAELAAPLAEVNDRLRALETGLDDVERQLPMPRYPEQAGRRVTALREALTAVRCEMFALGLIDEPWAVALPADPLLGQPLDDPRTWASVARSLELARRSMTSMQEAAALAEEQLEALGARIRDLMREASRPVGGAASLPARVEEVEADADALADRLGASWLEQLDHAERIIATCLEPMAQAEDVLNGINERVGSVAETVDATPRDTQTLRGVRDAWAVVCRDLEAASDRVGAGADGAPELPTNPFESRRLKDRRVLSELSAQLEVASAASATLRALVAEQRIQLDRLNTEAAALRHEAAKSLESGGSSGELEQRVSNLALAVLALHDQI